MAFIAPAPTRLPDLPNEILLLIIQKCPRATLKNVRLASKSLAQMADPYLWRKVVLVPNDHCILGFIKGLKRSKVTRHVTKLTYDARFGSFFHHIKTYEPEPGITVSQEEKTQGNALLDRAAQGRFQPYEDMAIEVAMLTKALRMLPNLREALVRDYEDIGTVSSKVPSFYHKICHKIKVNPEKVNFSLMAGSSGRSYTKGILTAAFSAGSRLQTFKTKNIDGRAMFGVVPMKSAAAYQQLSIFQAIMENLRVLDLSFKNDSLLPTANHIEAVQALLKSAKKLKTLRLRLTDCSVTRYQYSDDELLSDLSGMLETPTGSWICRPLLPQLETLMIDACICHDEDLIHFLKIHSATLRRLELSNITLLGGEDRRECWVKMIKHLKTDLKLTSISFSGWFSNGGRQQWFVAKDNVGTDRLKAKVENYVIDKRIRECPLEPIAIKPNQGDVEKPTNGEEYEGDLTWTMVYSNRFGDQMDWQLTEPSFGIPSVDLSDPSSADDDTNSAFNQGPSNGSDNDEPYLVPASEQLVDIDEFLGIKPKKPKSNLFPPKPIHYPTAAPTPSSSIQTSTWNPFSSGLGGPNVSFINTWS
ncbi:uncharacterized protein Z518_03887 [Rhinocladiella mackenziei CBS 650.93]|uniref:F-box domain-containing protein n=1 Tax=Rhinocladiella mackenziei CBS 650.93 TaxID=1442369 RepID=A0A0D2H694_9EURO|nr:uncharacterized protein Z518_03887 [Rhinocladiella mackenziei CBS 650.93]KIX05913.1 hypothetical protein Z518_03887 [Rhinocladiella mackenziei CBS 650.93]